MAKALIIIDLVVLHLCVHVAVALHLRVGHLSILQGHLEVLLYLLLLLIITIYLAVAMVERGLPLPLGGGSCLLPLADYLMMVAMLLLLLGGAAGVAPGLRLLIAGE